MRSHHGHDGPREYQRDNPEKPSRQCTQKQDEETENKNTTEYVLDTTMRKQTQIT